jgi:hypothetical protein
MQISSYIILMLMGVPCVYRKWSYIILYITLTLMGLTFIINIDVDWHKAHSWKTYTQPGHRKITTLGSLIVR